MRIGVISDTHGLLRREALTALSGVEHILHAGDVGDPAILDVLAEIAPLTVIRGNVDRGGRCAELPSTDVIEVGGTTVYMVHSLADLDLDPVAAQIGVVVSGHSHRPSVETRRGVLYLNPGSAGPKRFSLPVTVAIVAVKDGLPQAEIVTLMPDLL